MRGTPWIYLLVGLMFGPLAWQFSRALAIDTRCRRIALVGWIWPILTMGPLFGLEGGMDMFRLGLLLSLGFGLIWGVLLAGVVRRFGAIGSLFAVPLAFVAGVRLHPDR